MLQLHIPKMLQLHFLKQTEVQQILWEINLEPLKKKKINRGNDVRHIQRSLKFQSKQEMDWKLLQGVVKNKQKIL